MDVRTENRGRTPQKPWKGAFSCGPADGEKLFDPWSSGRKGQECPREIRTKMFMCMFMLFLFSLTFIASSGRTGQECLRETQKVYFSVVFFHPWGEARHFPQQLSEASEAESVQASLLARSYLTSAEKKKAYTTTTEWKSFWRTFLASNKTFPGQQLDTKQPIKTRKKKTCLPPKSFLFGPIFLGKDKFLVGAGRFWVTSEPLRGHFAQGGKSHFKVTLWSF